MLGILIAAIIGLFAALVTPQLLEATGGSAQLAWMNLRVLAENPDMWINEVDPENGTGGLVGNSAVPLLNGADHDEANETDD